MNPKIRLRALLNYFTLMRSWESYTSPLGEREREREGFKVNQWVVSTYTGETKSANRLTRSSKRAR